MIGLTDNMRGAVLMMLSMAAFTLNDTFIKSVSGEVPLFQAILIRGLITTLLIAAVAVWQGAFRISIARADRKVITRRTLGEVGATVCFLTALFNMPLANATAIIQTLPLALTLAGVVFLGYKVGWRRYGAIFIGFSGMLLIVKPGSEGFDIYALIAMAAVGFVVLRDLSTTRLSKSVPSIVVAFVTAVVITLMGAVGTAIKGWQPVAPDAVTRLGVAAVFIFGGYLLSIMVMRVGEIAFVSPFRYTALVWAIILGVIAFGEVPDAWTLVGSLIVVGTGIYTFYRERQVSRRAGG